MQYVLIGVTHHLGFRVFEFEAIEKANTIKYQG